MAANKSKQEILLESGTNELEVLVFSMGPTHYGVNVAKVREVIGQVELVKVPMTHHAVIGVFKLRDRVIPLIDLQLYFEPGSSSDAENRNVILMEFNDRQIGFLVDSVQRIYRMSWQDVRPMPLADQSAIITSVCEVDEKLALMIDFEKIAFDVNDDDDVFSTISETTAAAAPVDRGAQRIILAEDSPTIRNAIESNLTQAGYTQVTALSNGDLAWQLLQESVQGGDVKPFTVVITDIEMPEMDGLHLCKRVKDHPEMKHMPVVVFSSLVSDTNLKKCHSVGADAAVTKPQMAKVVDLLDQLLARAQSATANSPEEDLVVVS